MTTDIALDTDLLSSIDAVGDLNIVSDDDYLVQRAVLRILDTNVDWQGQTITPGRVADYRSKVEQTLVDDAVIDVPIEVTVNEVEGSEITLTVQLGERTIVVDGP